MTKISKCKCGENILWMKTQKGKLITVNYDEFIVGQQRFNPLKMIPHYSTCQLPALIKQKK